MKNDLESRVAAIEARNRKVEANKAWETSWARRLSIALLTYAVIVVYLEVINNSSPFVNALVPVAGYLISTLVMSSIRDTWESKYKRRAK